MLRGFRFGFLSLFAAMLLMVSGAGWWKFHRDLYVEEVEALQTLRRAGLTVNVRRAEESWAKPPEDEETIPWNAPLIAPLELVSIDGTPTAEARSVALRLPRLSTYGEQLAQEEEREERDRVRGNPPDPFDVGSFLGEPLPAIGESGLDEARLEAPLPQGEAVSDAEVRRIADEIRDAWRNPGAVPGRLLIHSHKTFFAHDLMSFDGERNVYVDDGERQIWFVGYDNAIYSEMLAVYDGGDQLGYWGRGGAWKRKSRFVDRPVGDFEEQFRDFPRDDFPYHALNVHGNGAFEEFFDALPQIELERVEKIDDVRYRVDFASFVAKQEAPQKPNDQRPPAPDPRIVTWQTVLRSDLDWAPEEILLVERVRKTDYEIRLVQRFERIDGHVVLAERLLNDVAVSVGPQERSRTTFAARIDPQVADSAFDPATLDAEVWPEPRPLPVLRWYRVTFVISLVLFGFLIARSLTTLFRRRAVATSRADITDEQIAEPVQT